MATHIYRKRFEHITLARLEAEGFDYRQFQIHGLQTHAAAVEDAVGAWIVLTISGDMLPDNFPLLPHYERVT